MMNKRMLAVLSAAAATALAAPVLAQEMDMMGFADGDKDGKVSPAEYATFVEQGWSYITQDAEQVKLADVDPMMRMAFNGVTPDANGVVTKAAYLAATPTRFKMADKNGDGSIDAAELAATMQPPA